MILFEVWTRNGQRGEHHQETESENENIQETDSESENENLQETESESVNTQRPTSTGNWN